MSTPCFIQTRALGSLEYFIWMMRRYWVVVPVLLIVAGLGTWWSDVSWQDWFSKTDKFALGIQVIEVVLILSIALYASASEWKQSLPMYQTVVFQDISGRPLFIVPYIPLTAMGDVRQQAQAALKSWNDNANLPIDQMLYDIIEQGVWLNKEKILNDGKPFNHIVTIVRKNSSEKDESKLSNIFNPGEGKVKIGIYPSRKLAVSKGLGEVSTEVAQNWLAEPQCLPPIAPISQEAEKDGLKCMGKCYIVTRHGATRMLLEEKLNLEACEHLTHLDEASLTQLNKGDCVFGNLPFALVKALSEKQVRYFNLDIDLPESERGKELDQAALEKLNPRITEYQLQRIGEGIPLT